MQFALIALYRKHIIRLLRSNLPGNTLLRADRINRDDTIMDIQ